MSGANYPKGNYWGGNFLRGNYPEGNYSGGQLSEGQLSWGAIVLFPWTRFYKAIASCSQVRMRKINKHILKGQVTHIMSILMSFFLVFF